MNRMKQLRKTYIDYLKENPTAYGRLKESCDFLFITKSDFK